MVRHHQGTARVQDLSNRKGTPETQHSPHHTRPNHANLQPLSLSQLYSLYLPSIPKAFTISRLPNMIGDKHEPTENFETWRRAISSELMTPIAAIAPEQLLHLGFVPSHVVALAERLASVHPVLKDDMGWGLQQWLHELSRRA